MMQPIPSTQRLAHIRLVTALLCLSLISGCSSELDKCVEDYYSLKKSEIQTKFDLSIFDLVSPGPLFSNLLLKAKWEGRQVCMELAHPSIPSTVKLEVEVSGTLEVTK